MVSTATVGAWCTVHVEEAHVASSTCTLYIVEWLVWTDQRNWVLYWSLFVYTECFMGQALSSIKHSTAQNNSIMNIGKHGTQYDMRWSVQRAACTTNALYWKHLTFGSEVFVASLTKTSTVWWSHTKLWFTFCCRWQCCGVMYLYSRSCCTHVYCIS